jgi:hypothetical protein
MNDNNILKAIFAYVGRWGPIALVCVRWAKVVSFMRNWRPSMVRRIIIEGDLTIFDYFRAKWGLPPPRYINEAIHSSDSSKKREIVAIIASYYSQLLFCRV